MAGIGHPVLATLSKEFLLLEASGKPFLPSILINSWKLGCTLGCFLISGTGYMNTVKE
jgi:hypothetical protein